MLQRSLKRPRQPRRVLMTVDTVGGVWRYAIDAAEALNARGTEVVLAVVGPGPTGAHVAEVRNLPATSLVHLDEPLDWLVARESDLTSLAPRIRDLVETLGIDLVQVNVPSQAADLNVPCPVVAVAHSCVLTWWSAVRGSDLPDGWSWQESRTRAGLLRADAVVAPSRSHADALEAVYGPLPGVFVVPNAVRPAPYGAIKRPVVVSAGRWWDEGKNARLLDRAAALISWPMLLAGALTSPTGETIALNHARSVGELPGTGVRDLMERAGIFVSPSLYEPFGLTVLEAAHAACPLVLSDIPTFRELWDGAAVFAPKDDAVGFAHAIERLAADAELRKELGIAARTRALDFTLDRTAEGLLAAYAAAGGTTGLAHAVAAE